jgi:hypothetical protein
MHSSSRGYSGTQKGAHTVADRPANGKPSPTRPAQVEYRDKPTPALTDKRIHPRRPLPLVPEAEEKPDRRESEDAS